LSTQLVVAPQAAAMSTNNASVTSRRAVVAWHDEKGAPDERHLGE